MPSFLEKFTQLKKNKILSAAQIKIVQSALNEKNTALLKTYENIFQTYFDREKIIISRFIENKNKLLHQFNQLSSMVKHDYVTLPLRKRIKRTEQQEKRTAENLLKRLAG